MADIEMKCLKHKMELKSYPKGSTEQGMYCPECEKERILESDKTKRRFDNRYDEQGNLFERRVDMTKECYNYSCHWNKKGCVLTFHELYGDTINPRRCKNRILKK